MKHSQAVQKLERSPLPPFGKKPKDNQNSPEPAPKQGGPGKGKNGKIVSLVWVLIGVLAAIAVYNFAFASSSRQIDTSQGFELLKGDTVEQVNVNQGTNTVTLSLSKPYKPQIKGRTFNKGRLVSFQYLTGQTPEVMAQVEKANPKQGFDVLVPQQSMWWSLAGVLLPVLLLMAFFWYMMGKSQGGIGNMLGNKRIQMIDKETPTLTFNDVAGVDEAVEELQEIKDFLKTPAKFRALGARIPKGVLLYGPPGTGKTLLARAVAGEAGVSFFNVPASEFVEMFVGMGASRVRNLFDQAKKNAPAIIFIDEIDAIGRNRGGGSIGGHDEREQTLNQMLVEMDGFDSATNVIVIAATNRPDVLDAALLRPGRFDRQVGVDAPDLKGRVAILQVHAKGKPMTHDVDLEMVARKTPGFTGADLANVLNEAALLTARGGGDLIDNRAIDEAIDRVMAGPQRRSRLMTEDEKKMTAYHEGGHALAAAAMNHSDPVTKVTILPRGRALGYTMVMPTEDRYSVTRNQLLDKLTYGLGGLVAEEVVYHDPSTGASNDIQNATKTARAMVTEYGMSSRIGAVRLSEADGGQAFGHGLSSGAPYSEQMARVIDEEVRALMENARDEAWQIITNNRAVLDRLVLALLEKETLGQDELAEIFKDVVKLPPRPLWLSSPDRPVMEEGPINTAKAKEQGPAETSLKSGDAGLSSTSDVETDVDVDVSSAPAAVAGAEATAGSAVSQASEPAAAGTLPTPVWPSASEDKTGNEE